VVPALRDGRISLLKAVGCVLIVWHHAVQYSPWAQAHLSAVWPKFHAWLDAQAGMAVQWFLVAGGYLAYPVFARAMRMSTRDATQTVLRRFLRLTAPLFLAMSLSIAVAHALASVGLALMPSWAQDVSWRTWLSHSTLTQDWFGHTALSAGVWYIAIDLQLFAMGMCLSLGLGRVPRAWPWVFAVGVLLSWWHLNTQADWDVTALYFFGAYGAGALLAWSQQQGATTRSLVRGLLIVALLIAQTLQWRDRLCWAAFALLLLASSPTATQRLQRVLARLRLSALVDAVANRSYGMFLIHYALLLGLATLAHFLWQAGDWLPVQLAMVLLALVGLVYVAAGWLERASAWGRASPAARWLLCFLVWTAVALLLLV
jgi:peptidoglycan/LPS O-acetylase OafA/YrhL